MFRARMMAGKSVRLIFDPYSPVLVSHPGFWTHLSYDYPSLVKDQALHVIGDINEHDLVGSAHDRTYSFGYNSASQINNRVMSNDAYVWEVDVDVSRNYTADGLNIRARALHHLPMMPMAI